MWKIFIPLLFVIGLATAVMLDPSEFWLDAEPNFVAAGCGAALFTLFLLIWVGMVYDEKKMERDVALSAYITFKLTDEQRKELAEPDPWYGQNSGIMRWKKNARQSPIANLIPTHAPSYDSPYYG